jgi:SAM-dependent methyltransferase
MLIQEKSSIAGGGGKDDPDPKLCPLCNKKIIYKNRIVYKNIQYPQIAFFNELKIHRCKNCSFSFAYPFIPSDKLEFFYKNGSYFLHDDINKNLYKYYYPSRIISLIVLAKFFINFLPNDSILDIGCDYGDSFYVISKIISKLKFTAVEPNKKTYANLNRLGVTKIVKKLQSRSIVNKKYKLIIASHVIEHLNGSDVKPFLLNLKKITEKKGYLLIEVPFDDLLLNENKTFDHPTHLSFFSIESLRNVLKTAGYKINYCNYIGQNRDKWWDDAQNNYVNGLYRGGKLRKLLFPLKVLLPQAFKVLLKRIMAFLEGNVNKKDVYSILNSSFFSISEKGIAIRILAQKI